MRAYLLMRGADADDSRTLVWNLRLILSAGASGNFS
jgi:hypothetical protein